MKFLSTKTTSLHDFSASGATPGSPIIGDPTGFYTLPHQDPGATKFEAAHYHYVCFHTWDRLVKTQSPDVPNLISHDHMIVEQQASVNIEVLRCRPIMIRRIDVASRIYKFSKVPINF